MATTCNLTLAASVRWNYQNVLATGNSINQSAFTFGQTLAQGTNANQADSLIIATGTLAASGNTTIALNGSVVDFFGNTVNMLRCKLIYLTVSYATPSSSSSVSVGNATNPFINWVGAAAHVVNVRSGGVLMLVAPDATAYVVTPSTGMNLKMVNNDSVNAATYNVALAGSSV